MVREILTYRKIEYMDANRLSKTMQAALNAQMNKENHQAQIYLSYGCWADSEGYEGISNFLFRHSKEERDHMMKFLEYILKRGGKVTVSEIPAPSANPTSVNDCFEKGFKHEGGGLGDLEFYAVVCQGADGGGESGDRAVGYDPGGRRERGYA